MKRNTCKAIAILMTIALIAGLSACGGGGSTSDYDAYATAYRRVTAEGGMDVDLSVKLNMNGTDKEASGNFKVDNSGDNTILYLSLDIDGEHTTQFSDGVNMYTDARGQKVRYPLGEKQERVKEKDDPQPTEENAGAPTFDTNSFLKEFASFLEAGKIKELGLLEPLNSAAVSKTTREGNDYTLTVSDAITTRYLNTLASNVMADEEETVEVKDLKDFTYKATVENDYVTKLNCTGSMTVLIPASISDTGAEASYDLTIDLTASFNNPGQAVTITLPSTDGYVEG